MYKVDLKRSGKDCNYCKIRFKLWIIHDLWANNYYLSEYSILL